MTQLPRRSMLGLLAGGFVAFLAGRPASASANTRSQIRAGDVCKKLGRRQTAGNKTFECVDVAGVRQWKRVRTPVAPATPTTSEVKVLESSALAAGRSANVIVTSGGRNFAVVLTRAPGGIAAFSRSCTHQGSLVSANSSGQLACPSHGAIFDASTGAVIEGPAARPLTQYRVSERSGSIYLTI